MVDIKEIKSVSIVPFTVISSAISTVLGLLYAIIFVILIALVGTFMASLLPSEAGPVLNFLGTISVALIFILPIGAFLLSILSSFLIAFIYNLLVPRIGGIKLGIEGDEVKTLPVIPLSLMGSVIYTILTILLILIIGPLFGVIIQGMAIAASLTNQIPDLSGISTIGSIGVILLIIGAPILVFVSTFIALALTALFYNLLSPKIGGVKFIFTAVKENVFEIKEIPVIQLALISAVVLTIVRFIFSLLSVGASLADGNVSGALGYLIGNTIGNLIIIFILYAIMALLYNLLRPKIGGVKLELD